MAKVIMTCGKICSGKSAYAEIMRRQSQGIVLSVDEVMLALFGQNAGSQHDEYVRRTQQYLFGKSVELIESGVTVILDWGFWKRAERDFARTFYTRRNIAFEFHYIDIRDEVWRQRLEQRNRLVETGEVNAYFVDETLVKKFNSMFEIPEKEEMDAWIQV